MKFEKVVNIKDRKNRYWSQMYYIFSKRKQNDWLIIISVINCLFAFYYDYLSHTTTCVYDHGILQNHRHTVFCVLYFSQTNIKYHSLFPLQLSCFLLSYFIFQIASMHNMFFCHLMNKICFFSPNLSQRTNVRSIKIAIMCTK